MNLPNQLRCPKRIALGGARGALAATVLLLAVLPAFAQNAVISHAEAPARLLRKTTVFQAPAGVRLQAGDIVEAGARSVQIEWANGARFALGPGASLLVKDAGGLPALSVLRGWSKFATNAPAGGRLSLEAGAVSLQAAGASGILHLAPDKTELFVETGTVALSETDRADGQPLAVGREQYAQRDAVRPLALTPRAPRLFISSMPRVFLDPLVAVSSRAPAVAPTPLREVNAADLAAWHEAGPALRKRLVAQFAPRLADPAFRKEAESTLADAPEWRDALRRHTAARNRANTPLNYLF
ncbi:hypothetical protein B0920_06190 [Massilia sp. KIM]|uniref:hypothetical protein n=1 Tax=Massilia sp. KIM TaxID=1955422 RepID=UPI0009901462|nr:hypothetical protein [Massilia sp. KIM]OON63006.1 hypothetical protein B0920_06190 [Massilia sp. KIM]